MTITRQKILKSKQQGVSLVELIVTLAILVILLSVAVPSFQSIRDANRVKAAAEAVYAHLQFARSESVKQNRNLFVGVKTGTNWCIGLSNATGCDCKTANSCRFGPNAALIERNLDSSDFSGITLASNQANIRFESRRGFNSNPGTITLTGSNSLQIQVIHSSRGRIRFCSDNVGGYPTCED